MLIPIGFLQFSKAFESEADMLGLELMARAGFNPQEGVHLWQKMSRSNAARVPQFLSTHPDPATRASDLEVLLPTVPPTAKAVMHCQKPPVPEAAPKLGRRG